jgi:hypothetical protein
VPKGQTIKTSLPLAFGFRHSASFFADLSQFLPSPFKAQFYLEGTFGKTKAFQETPEALGDLSTRSQMEETVKAATVLLIVGSLALGGVLAQNQPNPPAQNQQNQQNLGPGKGGPRQDRGLRGAGFNLYFQAAQFLGVTPGELAQLSDGTKTLAQIATGLGKTPAALEAALVTARNAAIDQAVKDQRVTAEQATQLKSTSAAVVKALVQQPVQFRGGPGMGGKDGRRGPGRGPGR